MTRRIASRPEKRGSGWRDTVFGWPMRLALLLAVFWVVLSGQTTPLFVALGVLSIALVCWLTGRAGLVAEDGASLSLALRLPRYLLWLVKEVFVSALAVVRAVWAPRLVLRPGVAPTPSPEMSELAQVVYANSITLTPGTLSLDVDDDQIKVHALEHADLEALHAGRMLGRVRRLEERR